MRRSKRLLATGLFFILTALPMATFAQNLPSYEGGLQRTVSLQDVLKRINESPTLKAAAKNIDVQDGLAEQAGLLPNPELAVEVENFAGENELEGIEGAETTVAISQLIELGGKRSARKSIATHEKALAEWEFQILVQDLHLETMRAFYAVLAGQERLSQSAQLLDLAEQGYQTVADRVEAGKVSPVQQLRASVELNMARNAFEIAKRQRVQTRQDLSALWGDAKPDFDNVTGDFNVLHEPPNWSDLQASFLNNPSVKRWEAELVGKKAELALESAKRIPDVSLSFGVRNFQETNNQAFVAGLEIPLQLFDRNQGERKAAQARVSQIIYQRDAAVAKLASDLQSSYQALLATFHQARTIKQDIMPAAEQANEAAQIGYQEGKFGFMEALDAQRTLFEVKAQYIDALSAYHEARLKVMRMTGSINRDSSTHLLRG